MARGGPRINSGPPPDPRALRRDRKQDVAGWKTLPAGGRTGKTPKWPLLDDLTRRATKAAADAHLLELAADLQDEDGCTAKERAALMRQLAKMRQLVTVLGMQIAAQDATERLLWAELWKTPQAAAWEQLGWTRDVAAYVRHKTLGELGSLADAKEARQWSDRLGLNPVAMLRTRWRVSVDEVAPRRAAAKKTAAKRASSRSRLQVVPDAAGE